MSNKRSGSGRSPSQRQLRVGEELRHALAEVLRRGDFRDPELQNLNVTVTEVRISPDLRNATAFITPLGGGQVGETVAAMRRAAAFFRAQIARAIKLRYVPTLSFEAIRRSNTPTTSTVCSMSPRSPATLAGKIWTMMRMTTTRSPEPITAPIPG